MIIQEIKKWLASKINSKPAKKRQAVTNKQAISIMMSGLTAYAVLIGFLCLIPTRLLFYWGFTDLFVIAVLFVNESWRKSQGEKVETIGELLGVMILDFGYYPVQFVVLTSFIWIAPLAIVSWIYFLGEWVIVEVKKAKEKIDGRK